MELCQWVFENESTPSVAGETLISAGCLGLRGFLKIPLLEEFKSPQASHILYHYGCELPRIRFGLQTHLSEWLLESFPLLEWGNSNKGGSLSSVFQAQITLLNTLLLVYIPITLDQAHYGPHNRWLLSQAGNFLHKFPISCLSLLPHGYLKLVPNTASLVSARPFTSQPMNFDHFKSLLTPQFTPSSLSQLRSPSLSVTQVPQSQFCLLAFLFLFALSLFSAVGWPCHWSSWPIFMVLFLTFVLKVSEFLYLCDIF